MKLMTAKIEKALVKYPLYSQENEKNPKVICKFFSPYANMTWYVTEGSKQENGDWLFFGKVVAHGESELGYFCLSELQKARVYGVQAVERDMYFDMYTPLNEAA